MWKIVVMTIDGSDSLVPVERKNHNSSAGKRTRDLLIKLQVPYQLSYQGIHALSPPQDWSQSSDHMLCTICPYRLVTYDLWFEGLPPCIKVHLDCLAAYVQDCCYDNRWLWQSGACGEKKITIPQPGNEPGTSWLSFRCSTNWATKESMLSHLHKTGHSPVTICYAPFAPTGWWLMTFCLRGCLHV